ncbi:conserved unknown protein [Ectocarpus siliculosus]|uniref:UEV domain-containing protein n=1 Tax=Ectocarpus siliculosus TaxID=2880 RepID=D8LU50_ECTSI|nr:conserved unknown protein [Ectocarpus siliculosus]|eukprot:CBN78092.1 conserved unknown protein [Ectocarpus siliculosus]
MVIRKKVPRCEISTAVLPPRANVRQLLKAVPRPVTPRLGGVLCGGVGLRREAMPAPRNAVNLNQLIAQFPRYQDPNRIRTDVLNVWRHHQSLVPKRGRLTLNTGQECELLMLEGTFPIVYRAVTYFTPVEIYISENYPTSPPVCYIRPTAGKT